MAKSLADILRVKVARHFLNWLEADEAVRTVQRTKTAADDPDNKIRLELLLAIADQEKQAFAVATRLLAKVSPLKTKQAGVLGAIGQGIGKGIGFMGRGVGRAAYRAGAPAGEMVRKGLTQAAKMSPVMSRPLRRAAPSVGSATRFAVEGVGHGLADAGHALRHGQGLRSAISSGAEAVRPYIPRVAHHAGQAVKDAPLPAAAAAGTAGLAGIELGHRGLQAAGNQLSGLGQGVAGKVNQGLNDFRQYASDGLMSAGQQLAPAQPGSQQAPQGTNDWLSQLQNTWNR